MISTIFQAITVTACIAVVLMGVFLAINKMDRCTHHFVRAAYVLITSGAFGILSGQLFGAAPPGLASTLGWTGIALFIAFDRRRHFVVTPRPGRVIVTRDSAN